ncbi:MAG TPA: 23S rRNA (guanosine(2251)-2'-O)-methyltransferase RlmB [Acidobacteriaceae bacterium]|jgi:23S rRNA (guanosine2251-2'-O)-methyltransferase|nr:23S rRNA (guanosine(2251)-2'-O)-methyltransferase RlmB [Acidobacteriaceae bacterium]
MDVLYGLHPVEEAIRAGGRRLESVMVLRSRQDARLQRVIDACRESGIRLRFEPKEQLNRLAGTEAHQGVVAVVAGRSYADLDDLLIPHTEHLFLLALDGVEDPHNLGALLRTADAAGVDGVLLPERRSAQVNATAAKVSAGAVEHVRIARVTNMVRSLEELKRNHVWCVGLDERGTQDYDAFNFCSNCVLVLGREGAGLHDLVRRTCDYLLRIPMAGKVASLNVSVAGAVVMYEAMRQRRQAAAGKATDPTSGAMKKPAKQQKGLGS